MNRMKGQQADHRSQIHDELRTQLAGTSKSTYQEQYTQRESPHIHVQAKRKTMLEQTMENMLEKSYGTWKMASAEAFLEYEEPTMLEPKPNRTPDLLPFGRRPKGQLNLFRDGRVVVMIGTDVEEFNVSHFGHLRENLDETLRGATHLYHGTYDYVHLGNVNGQSVKSAFIFHVRAEAVSASHLQGFEISNIQQLRFANLSAQGDKLQIRTPLIPVNGKNYVFYVEWEKIDADMPY